MIENEKIVKVKFDLFVHGETPESEVLVEQATESNPLVYCHGEGMMIPAFEKNLAGKNSGDKFDFWIPCSEAHGEHNDEYVQQLPRDAFFIDGEFDSERVFEGAQVPMHTYDGGIQMVTVIEVADDHVTIDGNHPFAGEDLHFVGQVLEVRDATKKELDRLRSGCGGCGGGCNNSEDCGNEGCGSNGCGSCCGGCGIRPR